MQGITCVNVRRARRYNNNSNLMYRVCYRQIIIDNANKQTVACAVEHFGNNIIAGKVSKSKL